MRSGHGRLREEQTRRGIHQVHARNARTRDLGRQNLVSAALGDPRIIILWIKSVGRQLQPTAALDAAMAGRLVAAALRENAADVASEAERARRLRALNANRRLSMSTG